MQTALDMPKDRIFNLRLDEEDLHRLAAVAEYHGKKAAQLIRELIRAEAEAVSHGVYTVNGWDGSKTTCLFFITRDREAAFAKAKELAARHASDDPQKWTVFRVFKTGSKADDDEALHRELVHYPAKKKQR